MKKKYILTISALTIFSGVFNEQTVNAMSDRVIEREKVTITGNPRVRTVDDIADAGVGTTKETSDIVTRRVSDDRYDDDNYYDSDRYVVRRSYGRPYRRYYRRGYYNRPYRRYYDSGSRRYRRYYYDDYDYDRGGRVLGGAATGAIIGGAAGGGRGAAIGAGVGAGLGLLP